MVDVLGSAPERDVAGKYRLVAQIGRGGTADVHLAVARGLGGFQKLVVLKMLKQGFGDDEHPEAGELRAMFLNEARLAARLRHPNLVETYEVTEDSGLPVIVMEYLDGQALSQVIMRGRAGGFSLAMQLRVLADALAGLHAAHELTDVDGAPLGIVHRDVSPQNVFVTIEGHTKVLDFGIAKLACAPTETEAGTIKGKLRYMAPEQLAGGPVDRRTDLYAVGVMLWEALCGERMWKGLAEEEIKSRVRRGELPLCRPLTAEALRATFGAQEAALIAAVKPLCLRALALDRGLRPRSALVMLEELERALARYAPGLERRALGATIARLFEDVRAQSRIAIERKLSSLRVATPLPEPSVPLPRLGSARLNSGPVVGALERPAGPELSARRGSRVARAAALTGAVVVALVVTAGSIAVLRRARHAHQVGVNVEPRVAASPAAGSEHAPGGPTLALSATPRTIPAAAVAPGPEPPLAPVPSSAPAVEVAQPAAPSLRGTDARGPHVAEPFAVALAETPRRERRRHKGRHDPASRARAAAPVPLAPASSPTTASAQESPAAAVPPKPDCAYPFFIDADGIKHFRLECR